jgi:hypothetical protein
MATHRIEPTGDLLHLSSKRDRGEHPQMHHGEIEELHLVLRGMCHVTVRLQILAQALPMQLLLHLPQGATPHAAHRAPRVREQPVK